MPCEKPTITDSLEDCCFTCYTSGRSPYLAPLAIVLHEYDGHIEELNNEMEACCNLPQDCHASFHFGVGESGQTYKWVDLDDTAWSFDPIRTDDKCGVCNWSFAATQGSQHPNLYTINIAVATGTGAIKSGRRWPNNVFDEKQYKALVQLIGWLAETYSITVNQNMIWRHCGELADFPDLCGGCTYSDFLQDIQDCIDSQPICVPAFCSEFCDCNVVDGVPEFILGADDQCDECGRYRLDLCAMIQGLQAGVLETIYCIGVDDQGECVAMEVDPDCNTTETVCSAFGVNSNGVPGFYSVKEQLSDRTAALTDSLIPATDRVVRIDASTGNAVFTLTPPADGCCPKDFWIKRTDCVSGNSVVINGGGNTIDGETEITLDTPGKWGAMGESCHVYWTGAEWLVI